MGKLEQTQRILGRAISLAGLISIVSLVGTSSASASLNVVRETATTVTSSLPDPVGSVVAPEPAPPPSPRPPSAPPIQIELPPAPQVNLPLPKVSAPKVSADPPAVTQPPPTSSRPGGEVTNNAATELADTVMKSGQADVTKEAGAVVTRQAGTKPPGSPAVAGPGDSVSSVEPHRPAPSRHWLTHVWPAIALGPFGELLTDLPAGPEGAALPLLSGNEVSRLLLGLTASTTTGGTDTASGISSASPAETGGIPLPGGGAIPFFVVIVFAAAVMALLMGAVRRELGALYRWWPH